MAVLLSGSELKNTVVKIQQQQKVFEPQCFEVFLLTFWQQFSVLSNTRIHIVVSYSDPDPLHCKIINSNQNMIILLRLFLNSRAVDPDPHGSALILPPGSGSRREKFSNKNGKNASKLVKSASSFNFLYRNLHRLHCFLLLSNLCLLQLKNTGYFWQICLSWIRIRVFIAAGSGSAFRKNAGSGSAKMNVDPQPWF